MNTLIQHRNWAITLVAGTCVMLLARPLTFLFSRISINDMLVESRQVIRKFPTRKIYPSRVMPTKPTQGHGVVEVDTSHMSLNPMRATYHYQLEGTARCNDAPCVATLTVTVDSTELAVPVRLSVGTNADGSYRLNVPFDGRPNQQTDWRITAVSADLLQGETHLHHILSDETSGTLTRDIELR